jgi:hypothetical protein
VFTLVEQVPVHHEQFRINNITKGICDAFSKKNQTSRGDWLHPTLAARNSDSDFAPDLSAAGLHISDPEASPLAGRQG